MQHTHPPIVARMSDISATKIIASVKNADAAQISLAAAVLFISWVSADSRLAFRHKS